MRWVKLFGLALLVTSACGTSRPVAAEPARPSSPPAPTRTSTPAARTPASPSTTPATATPPRAGRDFPDLPEQAKPIRLWGDGADVIVAAGRGRVFRITRGHAVSESRGPGAPLSFAVRGTGDAAAFVVVGEAGEYTRFQNRDWEFGLAPALDGEALAGAVIPSPTRMILAGQHRALYAREGDAWAVHRYPSGGIDVVHAAVDAAGTVFLLGAHGRLLAFSNGTFRDLPVAGVTSDVLNTAWLGGWYSPSSNTLWAFTSDWIVGIDLATMRARIQQIPLFFDVTSFAGARTPRGDIVAVGTMSDFALFDGTSFMKVKAEAHHSAGLYIDVQRATLYETEWDKMLRFPLEHPHFGTGPGEVLPNR